jgi:hypothetical protein
VFIVLVYSSNPSRMVLRMPPRALPSSSRTTVIARRDPSWFSDATARRGGIVLTERPVDVPWVKDYDATDGGAQGWAARFDVTRWGLLGAYDDERRIGGAVLAFDTPDLHMLRGRRDAPSLQIGEQLCPLRCGVRLHDLHMENP